MRRLPTVIAASALTLVMLAPALAQTERVTGEARRFLVYPVKTVTTFTQDQGDQIFYLNYFIKTARPHEVIVTVTRFKSETTALETCKAVEAYDRASRYDVRRIDGYACALTSVEHRPDVKTPWTEHRRTAYVVGSYLGQITENGGPGRYAPIPVEPLLAALKGDAPLSAAEVAFRDVVFRGLNLHSANARSCLDEAMTWAEGAAATDKAMADEIARLRKAAFKVHAIEVLSAVPLGPNNFDDFDPKWWDAARELAPDPLSPDATERVVDLLPPPFNTLIKIVRSGGTAMRAVKTHVVTPAAHGALYACYRRQRTADQSSRITDRMGQEALESAAVETLSDAMGAACPYSNDFKNSYERELKPYSGEARETEYKRLIRPVAIRFEFIYRIEDARRNRDARIADAWKSVQDVLARLKDRRDTGVNACLARR